MEVPVVDSEVVNNGPLIPTPPYTSPSTSSSLQDIEDFLNGVSPSPDSVTRGVQTDLQIGPYDFVQVVRRSSGDLLHSVVNL